MMERRVSELLRLAAFSDSALPVGGFSFSNGLETAAELGWVCDAATLEEYVRTVTTQTAFCDGAAALHAFRAAAAGELDGVLETDAGLWLRKFGDENRRMASRMGHRLTELAERTVEGPVVRAWSHAVREQRTPGCYAVAQGVLFAACGLDEPGLFASHLYGVANMLLNAALRCVRVSHYDTQAILYRLGGACDALYDEVRTMRPDELHLFLPGADLLASLHEKGTVRMFMN